MIGGDKNSLIPGTPASARLALQRACVERLDLFVFPHVHSWSDIMRVAKKEHYDVVTAQDPFWRGFLAWRIARKSGAKLNLQVHTDLSALSPIRQLMAFFLLRRADSIRVVSEDIQSFLITFLGSRAKISVLPIYIDLDRFTHIAHQTHERFAKTILWIGRFEKEKDPLEALKVLAKVRSLGVDAGLIMLGDGSLRKKVEEAAKGLEPFVVFPGWQDPAPYLAKADAVLSTSLHESYGASMVEALAAEVAVVAPDIGIAREAGAIVVPRTELANAILRVLKNGERGRLLLAFPSEKEWATAWKETL
jgi:glycosyltransferase involved in cell wall biosynthesis